MASTPARAIGVRARRRRRRRSRAASATAGSKTRSRTASGTNRRSQTAASGMSGARPGRAVGFDGVAVERAGGRPRGLAARRQGVAALLDDLPVHDLLVVLAAHEAGVLEPRHHLVERGPAAIDAVPLQRPPDRPSLALAAAKHAEDEELEVGDLGDALP